MWVHFVLAVALGVGLWLVHSRTNLLASCSPHDDDSWHNKVVLITGTCVRNT